MEHLENIMKHRNQKVENRITALHALASIGKKRAMEGIISALSDEALKDKAKEILIALGERATFFIKENRGLIPPEYAKEILDAIDKRKKKRFEFKDIVRFDNVALGKILREVDPKDLVLALKGADEEIKNKIFSSLTERAAQVIKEDLELIGPVRKKNVDEARERIINIILRLGEAGDIVISPNEVVL